MAKRKKAAEPAFAVFAVTHSRGQNLRSGPGMEHPVLRVLPQGATVRAAETVNGWARVEDGWMDTRCMEEIGHESDGRV